MTSAAVTERSGSIMNLAVQNTAVRTDGSQKGFTKVMDSMSESRNQDNVTRTEKKSFPEKDNAQTVDQVDETNQKDSLERPETDRVEENTTAETSEATETSETEEVAQETASEEVKAEKEPSEQAEDVVEAGEEAVSTQMYQSLIEQAANLMEQVADYMSVGTEDVMEAMKQLNMSMTDILNPEKLQELTLTLAGADRMTLLTDEKLYQVVQELTQLCDEAAKNLQETLGIEKDAWNGLLEKVAIMEEAKQPVAEENLGTTVKENVADVQTQEASEMKSMKDANQGMTVQNESTSGQTDMEASVQKGNQVVTVQAEEASEDMQEDTYAGNGEQQGFAEQMKNPVSENFEAPMKEVGAESRVNAEQIMKQILDFMKVRTGGQLSEIEMQLHPASLGTVHISLAAKNGVVTAQFTAQNEMVKDAIEGQIMILRENLEQQGIKVEAVEVTVASHEFERNLEQQAKDEEQNAREAEEKKKATRRINLDNLEEGEEIQDEAERITRDMMMRHGATLDYMA